MARVTSLCAVFWRAEFFIQLVDVALVDASPLAALSHCQLFHCPLSLSSQQDSKCLMRTQTCTGIASLSILFVNLGSPEPVEVNTAPSLRFRPNKQEILLVKLINYDVLALVFVCLFVLCVLHWHKSPKIWPWIVSHKSTQFKISLKYCVLWYVQC